METDGLEEVLCDPLDDGDIGTPAKESAVTDASGCPRVACRSRWLDTIFSERGVVVDSK